tara:strand:- start:972 stop:1736 length:765 start_codon:yes stop_codon:yes gene_type:complete
MKIKDELILANMSATDIYSGTLSEGAVVYNDTDKCFIYSDSVGIGNKTLAGREIFKVPTLKFPYEINSLRLQSQNQSVFVYKDSAHASPFMFKQDVKLTELRADVLAAGTFKGYNGVYKLKSKVGELVSAYYEFELVQQFTPTFDWTINGGQILSISPNFIFRAGEVYVLISCSDYVSGSAFYPFVNGVKRFGANRLLDNPSHLSYYQLVADHSYPSPYTWSFTPPNLPTTMWMKQEQDYLNSQNPVKMNIQNA